RADADDLVGAGFVDDVDLGVELTGQCIRGGTGGDVGRSARRERHHVVDRPARVRPSRFCFGCTRREHTHRAQSCDRTRDHTRAHVAHSSRNRAVASTSGDPSGRRTTPYRSRALAGLTRPCATSWATSSAGLRRGSPYPPEPGLSIRTTSPARSEIPETRPPGSRSWRSVPGRSTNAPVVPSSPPA